MMKRKILSLAIILAAILTGGTSRAATPAQTSPAAELLAMLPASDAVAFIDARRLHEVAPRVLAESPDTLAQLSAQLDRFRETSGFDLCTIDMVVVGFRFGGAPGEQMVAIARGSFEANERTINGFLRGAQRRQEHNGRTIYVRNREAFAPLNLSTVVFGDLESVRACLDAQEAGRGRVETDLVTEATRAGNAIAGFAARLPRAPRNSEIEGNEFFRLLAAVRQVSGAFSVTEEGSVEAQVKARTETADEAREIGAALLAVKEAAGQSSSGASGTSVALPGLGLIVSSALLTRNLEVSTEDQEVRVSARFAPNEVAAFVSAFTALTPARRQPARP